MHPLIVPAFLALLAIGDVTPPQDWITNPDHMTVAGLLLLALIAYAKEWIVPKTRYDAVVKERDALRGASDSLLKSYQERESEERLWRLERQAWGESIPKRRDEGRNIR